MQHTAHRLLDVRQDFPILAAKVNGKPLVYLDNGATTQKPVEVIDSIAQYYQNTNANVHRGVHSLSQMATDLFEESRRTVRQFLHAQHEHEIIFTRGTTESINLIADCFSRAVLRPGDEVVITELEHHSNIVPWQMACQRSGATLRFIYITESGEWDLSQLDEVINTKTKIAAISHVSNALGTINPVEKIIAKARQVGAAVLIDGAQAVNHMPVDVQALDADFYCFSGHKLFAPTGIGVLYGKESWLNQLPPYHGGGEMIKTVSLRETTYNDLPHKFEAGTPHIEGVIGLKAAIDYVHKVGFDQIQQKEQYLLDAATERLLGLPGLRIYGTAPRKASVISFLIDGIHPYDIGVLLDKQGIAVRTGHHCTQPIMDKFEIPGTVRASFSFYNNDEDIDRLIAGLEQAIRILS
ncbi:MAG TPA: cysteine desulfurase [Luteibaculaceae bacterium]|nr:cysteine desulfurase [Luteibaculaceae bacterium]